MDPLLAVLDQLKPSGVDRSPFFNKSLSKDLGNPGSLVDVGALFECILQWEKLESDLFYRSGNVGVDLFRVLYSSASWPLVFPILEPFQASLLGGLGVVLLRLSLTLLLRHPLLCCRMSLCYCFEQFALITRTRERWCSSKVRE